MRFKEGSKVRYKLNVDINELQAVTGEDDSEPVTELLGKIGTIVYVGSHSYEMDFGKPLGISTVYDCELESLVDKINHLPG